MCYGFWGSNGAHISLAPAHAFSFPWKITSSSRILHVLFATIDVYRSLLFVRSLLRNSRSAFWSATFLASISSDVDADILASLPNFGPMRSTAAIGAELKGPIMIF